MIPAFGTVARRAFAAALIVAAALALLPAKADAHANLAEAYPPPNSTLDNAPDRVSITFTEPIERALSEIRVLDRSGGRADAGGGGVLSEDALTLSAALGALANGTYTVAWRNVSAVDGHSARGAFVFSVGEPIAADAGAALEDAPALQSGAEPIARWLALLGGMAVVGAAVFRALVSSPALAARGATGARRALRMADFRLIGVGLALFLAGSLAQLVVQASVAFDTSALGAVGAPIWGVLTETNWGRLWIWRAALTFGAGAALFAAWRRGGGDGWTLAPTIALGAAALLTISLTSHAAATPGVRIEALVNDFVHLTAAAVWTGGLFALALAVSVVFRRVDGGAERRAALAAMVPRFSALAGASVAALILTGAFSAWAQVTIPQALATPYGAALRAKLAIGALLLALAAANLVYVRPRLRGDGRAARWLRRLVAAEAILAAAAILAVGFLASLEPARQVASREGIGTQDFLSFETETEGAALTVEIAPGRVGANEIRLSARDGFGDPITNAADVQARLSYLDADLGESAASMNPAGAGEFALEDRIIGLAGAWQVEIAMRRPDAFDARAAFRFEVSGEEGGSLAIAPDARTGRVLLAAQSGLLGFALLGAGLWMGGWSSRKGAAAMGTGVAAAAASALLAFAALGGGAAVQERNPIAPTAESIAAGMALYAADCQSCHGETGAGDGPAAAALDPPPADLITHVPLHPDRVLFGFIHDGIPDTGMAGMGGRLSDDEIWHLVNYIQTLE